MVGFVLWLAPGADLAGDPGSGFVSARATQLVLGGQPYRMKGLNINSSAPCNDSSSYDILPGDPVLQVLAKY